MNFNILVMLISYLSIANGDELLSRCCRQYDNVTVACKCIPNDIPKGILKFRLNIETSGTLVLNSSAFEAENWSKLQYLEITEKERTGVVLKDNCFHRLTALREIHIHVWYPKVFPRSLSGLHNVKTLDVSGCGNLSIEAFKLTISGSNILPGLNKIILSNWNLYRGSFAIDSEFVEILLPRNVTYIDVSKTQISELDFTAICKKLTYLEVFNASYATISNLHDAQLTPEDMRGIKVLDLSHSGVPKKSIPLPPGKLVWHDATLNFSHLRSADFKKLFAPETVNLSGTIPHFNSIWLYNITLILDEDPSVFTKNIKFQQNNLKRMDVRLHCDTFYFLSVQTFDVSDNGMEFVHPKLFLSCFRSLVSLDLSKNQLSKMVDENSVLFQNLFHGLKYLKIVRMSTNGLHKIPTNLFENCQSIEEIDLSYNRLEQVTFTCGDLQNLKVLDLQGNNVHILDSKSIHYLSSILHGSNVNSSTITVDLRANPISCSVCEAKPFLQWLISTNLINTASQGLKCLDENGKLSKINGNTVEMVQNICERKTVIISISVSAVAIFLFSVSSAILIYRRYKRKHRIQNRTNIINHLREGEGQYQFAIFLSFSNRDEEFVNTHILNQLNENLQLMTGIERTMVCTGDQNFRLGFNVHDETFRLLDSASVLIVVVSHNFLASSFCHSELKKAYEDRKPIVLMLIEQVDPNLMMPTMKVLYQKNTRILWKFENGEYVLKTSWENVCSSALDLILCEK